MNATRRITAGALSALCLAAFGGCSNSSKVLVLVPGNDSGGGSAVSAGLYKEGETSGAPLAKIAGLGDALERIKELGEPAASYTVVLDKGETLAPQTLSSADYGAKVNLKGVNGADGGAVTLQLSDSESGSLFTVTGASAEAPFTLALENITLKGVASNTDALVTVGGYGIVNAGTGAVITGNTNTVGEGGGVSVGAHGRFVLSGGAVTGNTVEWISTNWQRMPSGGGVSVTDGTFELTAGAVSGNKVINTDADAGIGGARGGGVTVLGAASFTMAGGSVDHNSVTGTGIREGGVAGGGLYINVSASTADIRGGSVSYNSVTSPQVAAGGGIFFKGTLLNIGDAQTAVSIAHNTAHGDSTSDFAYSTKGGGIYIIEKTSALHLMGNAAVSENAAEGPEDKKPCGGGIFAYNDATLTLSGKASITGNKAFLGGGIYSSLLTAKATTTGIVVENNATVSGNEAKDGGGVYIIAFNSSDVADTVLFTLKDAASLSGNSATGSGGGLYVGGRYGTLRIDGSISGNTSGTGGDIYSSATITITGGEV